MRAYLSSAGRTLPTQERGGTGTRPLSVRGTISVGRDVFPKTPGYNTLDPNDVTLVENGVRYFLDGSGVGMWRSLRSHRLAGLMEEDPDVVIIEPSWEGTFVPVNETAATWAERESIKGRYVIAPVFLAYDTPARRFLWTSATPEPAMTSDAFAVLLPPGGAHEMRSLANDAESGG